MTVSELQSGDLLPKTIEWLLSRRGLTFRDVDRRYELPVNTANKAARYPHIDGELAIADTLGLSPHQIWPSRYDVSGVRLRPQPRKNYENYTQKNQRSQSLRGRNDA